MADVRPTITIDIVSDVVCPWCIIGYRQLETAIEAVASRAKVDVSWHPFELVPGMAPEGQNTRDYMAERYGATPEQGRANRDKMVGIGQTLGIDFAFSEDSRIYNTHKAHQLLAWAADSGKQTALKLAFFDAYFTTQANISSEDILLAAVESIDGFGQHVRCPRHTLYAAGQDHIGFAERDGTCALADGFQAGSAQAVDGIGRSCDRQAGQ